MKRVLCGCQRPKQVCQESLWLITQLLKPSAWSDHYKNQKDGIFTITAKNLQGFWWLQGSGRSHSGLMPMGWKIICTRQPRQADLLIYKYKATPRKRWCKYEAQASMILPQGLKMLSRKPLLITNQSRPTGTLSWSKTTRDTGTFWCHHQGMFASPKGADCKFLPGLIRDGQDDIRWYEATVAANGDCKWHVGRS